MARPFVDRPFPAPPDVAGSGPGWPDWPAPDAERAAYTGLGRAHWEALADRMLLAVRPYASPRHGLIDLPGPASGSGRWSDGLEGFARTFLLAGFRLARGGERDPHNLAEWYASGLAAGVDPSSPERWPTFAEKLQAVVECASVALALHETRPYVWDRLDDSVRQQTIDWMSQLIGMRIWDNNWVWFQSITEAFLRSVGGPWSADDLAVNVEKTESWYTGDGWYSDGGEHRNFDYYSGWAMQFYPLWYCRVAGDDAEPGLVERYAGRLHRYLQDLQHFVAADGSPVFQGRSLTYRFAVLAPFWVGALFDSTPLPPGRTRRLASGVLQHFLSHGFLDERGLQSIGWHGAFEPMRQTYSGPGSPYWSSKGFAGLVLPEDHPVWTDAEQPLPIEQADVSASIAPAGFVLSGTNADGIVRITNHRSDHGIAGHRPDGGDDPVYTRYGYATHAAPDYGDIDVSSPLDSHVALVTDDGRTSQRRPFELLSVSGMTAVSRHRAWWQLGRQRQLLGPEMTTASVSRGALEVRLVRIDPAGSPDGPDPANMRPDVDVALDEGPWWVRFGGYPVAAEPEELEESPAAGDDDPASATARRKDGLTSIVRLLRVGGTAGVRTIDRANPLGERSRTPWARTVEPIAQAQVYAALVVLTGVEVDTAVDVETRRDAEGGDVATVHWPDGDADTVTLPAPSPVA